MPRQKRPLNKQLILCLEPLEIERMERAKEKVCGIEPVTIESILLQETTKRLSTKLAGLEGS